MEALSQPTVFFAMVLALSLLIERFIEVVKVFFDWLDYQFGLDAFWSKKAQQLHIKMRDSLGLFGRTNPQAQQQVINLYHDRTLNDAGSYKGRTLVISGDLIRVIFTRAVAKLLGVFFGVLLAYLFQIDLIAYLQTTGDVPPSTKYFFNLHIFVSGLAIGLGAGPVHKLITTIEKTRKRQKTRQNVKED